MVMTDDLIWVTDIGGSVSREETGSVHGYYQIYEFSFYGVLYLYFIWPLEFIWPLNGFCPASSGRF